MINEFRMNINNTEVAVLPRIALIYFMTLLGRASKYYIVIFPHSQQNIWCGLTFYCICNYKKDF